MDLQQTIGQYDASSDESVSKIVEDLETVFRKDGFTGEGAYRILCSLLVAKSYYERQGGQEMTDLLSTESPRKQLADILRSKVYLNGNSNLGGDLDNLSDKRLHLAIKIIDGLSVNDFDRDIFGVFYGRFFSDVFRGESGKFFTPRQVVSAMVELGAPQSNEVICDPACGSGGFLVGASTKLKNQGSYQILGNDNDNILAETTRSNLYIAGEQKFHIDNSDLFDGGFIEEYRESIDLILANPPFSLEYSVNEVWDGFENFAETDSTISDYLFLESAQHLLRPGGRLVSLFPISMIMNNNHSQFREMLRENWSEMACITLPEGVFYPYSGTSAQACILALVKDQNSPYYQYPSLKANINKVGYDTSRKTYTPIEQDDFQALFNSEEYTKFSDIRNKILSENNE